MKKVKAFVPIIVLISCLFALTSCERNFLSVTDPNRVTTALFWKTEADAKAAILTAYSKLQTFQADWDEWGPNELLLATPNLRGDETKLMVSWGYYTREYTFRPRSTDYQTYGIWGDYYSVIDRANLVLENVPGMSIDATVKNQVLGEAEFLRALSNFFLVNYYGNIVLRTSVPKNPEDYYKAQSPKADVYAQIEADLNDAITNLPQSWPADDAGRATKGAATGLLGKVYLYEKKWSQAETEFKKVTMMGYSLVSNYASLFDGTNENSSESLFEIQFSADKSGGRIEYWGVPDVVRPDQDFFLRPSDWLHSLYMSDTTATGQKSSRVYGSIVFNDTNSTIYYFNGKSYAQFMTDLGMTSLLNKSVFRKYATWDPSWGVDAYFNGVNYPVLRYADVLLMLAEALNEQGKTAEAIPYVNEVRNRAGSVPTGAMTQAQLRDHLQNVERPLELGLEGNRFFDLVRWGIVQSAFQAHNRDYATNFRPGIDEIWPIPSTEFDVNPKIVQNPGY